MRCPTPTTTPGSSPWSPSAEPGARRGRPARARDRPLSSTERPRRRLRILTFNTHEGFNYDLAKTGHDFDVLPTNRFLWSPEWDERSRPVRSNVHLLATRDLATVDTSGYDLLLAQTVDQFSLIESLPCPKLLLLHTAFGPGPGWPSAEAALHHSHLRRRLRDVPVVFVAEYCRRSWGLPGRVIPAAIDARDYREYRWHGCRPAALTVSHFFRERASETGYELHRRLVEGGLPFRVIGENPTLPGVGAAASWHELRCSYEAHRVYLNTTRAGASLALNEAAAVGMPIVTTPRADGAPLFTDGYDAFIASDVAGLRAAVLRLLENPSLGRVMGLRARATVLRLRNVDAFLEAWHDELIRAASAPEPPVPAGVEAPSPGDLRAQIDPDGEVPPLRPGQHTIVRVRLRNVGTTRWPCYTRAHVREVRLAYHWFDLAGNVVEWEGMRTPLPDDVSPGGEVFVPAILKSPDEPGTYVLRWDLVAEFVCWFSGHDGVTAREVRARVDPSAPAGIPTGRLPESSMIRPPT